VGGESASALAVQIIGATTYAMPPSCTGTQSWISRLSQRMASLAWAAICKTAARHARSRLVGLNPGLYYACPIRPRARQQHARSRAGFASSIEISVDNNGVIIRCQAYPKEALLDVGQLVFGIGTQTNNGSAMPRSFPSMA